MKRSIAVFLSVALLLCLAPLSGYPFLLPVQNVSAISTDSSLDEFYSYTKYNWAKPLDVQPSADPFSNGRSFGANRDPRKHAAVDLIAPGGTPVFAVSSGTVIYACESGFYLNTGSVEVRNEDGSTVRYGEVSPSVKIGDSVSKGQQIATVKQNSNGSAMLHFELYRGTVAGALTNSSNKSYKYVPNANYQRRADLLDPSYLVDFWFYSSDTNPYSNLGDEFYGVILNTAYWKPISLNTETGNVTLESEHNADYQKWLFTRQEDGAYMIQSCANGTALELTAGYHEAGLQLSATDNNWLDGDYQRWYLIKQGDGYVFLSKHFTSEGWVMELAGNSDTDGTPIECNSRNDEDAQIWSVYTGEEDQLRTPTLSVSAGTSSRETVFAWDSVYGSSRYDVKIWKDEVDHSVDSYHTEWGASSGYSIQLPPGDYEAYVTACDYFQVLGSQNVRFTVSNDPTSDFGDDFFGTIVHTASGKAITNIDGDVKLSAGEENDPRQIWHFFRVDNQSLYYVAYNTYDSSMLSVDPANGTNVISAARTGEVNQNWYIRQNNGRYCIAASDETLMSLADESTAAGTIIQLLADNGTDAQSFIVSKLENQGVVYSKPSAPDAPELSLTQLGCANEETVFEWNESPLKSDRYDDRTYNFRIWQGTSAGENTEVYLLAADLTETNYSTNLPAGTYTATVTAVNTKYHWYGTASAPVTFTVSSHAHTWDGGIVFTPATTTEDGVLTFTCSGCGQTKTETIASVSDITLLTDLPADGFTYNGAVKHPAVIVMDRKGKTLTEGTDYTVTYSSGCIAPGTYSVTISLMGNYSGIVKKSFTIVPLFAKDKPNNLKVAAVNANKVTLTWDAVPGAERYMVYYATEKDGAYKAYATPAAASYTFSKTGASALYYKVRAFITVDGARHYGAYSEAVRGVPGRVGNLNASIVSGNKVTLTWDAVPGAERYMVYYATEKDGAYKAYATPAAASYTFNKTGAGALYYKVRAFVTVDGARQYGAYSEAVRGVPGKVGNLNASIASGNKVTLTWDAVPGAERYMVYYATEKDGAYKAYATPAAASYTFSKTGAGALYYKVRAFVTVDGARQYGAYSEAVRGVPGKVGNLNASIVSGNKVTLTWDAVPGAERYMVYYATEKDGAYKAYATPAAASYTFSKTGASALYYKVRAYVTVNGVKQYGAYSDIASAK